MDRENFIKNLQVYGSELSAWPESIRQSAQDLCNSSPEIMELVENEKQFESILTERTVDEPSSDFERRITLSAGVKDPGTVSVSLLSSFFGLLTVPRPALTMGFLLLFGFSLGFFFDSYADAGEDTVEFSEYITFDEGEYYE